ncbi:MULTISPECIES: helix-turn-helix transcriptional regulator [unclassified Clostridioides]|nr:helix-turn-helix transcriptional regulator [Clostridioides sp. ZZV15-6388]MCC0644105.1 helix-turn-helix transcriptional regulator [Clostridioides sp. ZZV14-6150]MCC0660992.1 helix-turn-helix transcriptional regulator [Clostridioides sp. ZZV14-6154]MCC0664330.1 helix-turn-helix transcriptional regulator [Clostridioides sp. ZZV15-6597]MCC0668292.1 helix-turn-helix transcriptional regulator [Clostridioides sp. ZZV14-6153]MCC0720240.1 helix-turn-helix transcriptional regulator [Clostridioides s
MNLGDKIIKLRKKYNYYQELLAERLNVSRQTISKWELGV